VQLIRVLRPTAMAAVVCLGWVVNAAAQTELDDDMFHSLVRMFTDSKDIAVRSLMGDYTVPLPNQIGLSLHVNNEQVTIPGVSAPAGSQEAIDAITTASRPISGNAFQDYVKVRNEVQGELARGPAAVSLYLSSEQDYLAHQVAGRYGRDFKNQQLNVTVGTSYGWDDIKPLADDDTQTGDATKTTMHLDAVATRVLSPTTMVRFGLEYNLVEGLQHNPYRNVYAGGTIVPERHPDHRQRQDAFVKVNQYLPNRSSLKFSYRFYNDDWGIDSHELGGKLSQYITQGFYARYEYRYYTQTAADFYRDEYASVNGIDGYRSGDYRMDALSSHLFGFGINADLATLAATVPVMSRMGAWLSYERYFNSNNYSADILETGLDFRF
jgi:Protein of unknown function (DUF3570)